MTPTGSSVGANSRRATRSDEQHEERSDAGGGHDAVRAGDRRQAAGDRGGDEGDEDDRPGGRRPTARRARRRAMISSELGCARRATPSAAGGVVAELQHARAERTGRTTISGTRTTRAIADRADVLPAAPVEAAGEPHRGPLGVEDLGPGEQVVDVAARASAIRCRCRRARGGTRRHAALPGQQVDRERRRPGAPASAPPRRRARTTRRARRCRSTAAALAPDVDADDVGAGQRVAGDALEDRARDPEGGADEHRGERPRQAQRAAR